MSILVTENRITADGTRHTASRDTDGWHVTWLPGRALDLHHARTAIKLAVIAEQHDLTTGADPWWPAVDGWAGELSLNGINAVTRIRLAP